MYIGEHRISETICKSRVGLGQLHCFFFFAHCGFQSAWHAQLTARWFFLVEFWLAGPVDHGDFLLIFFLFLFPSLPSFPFSSITHTYTHTHITYKMAGGYTRFGPLPKPHVSRIHNFISKGLGATMWFWIFYRVREVSSIFTGMRSLSANIENQNNRTVVLCSVWDTLGTMAAVTMRSRTSRRSTKRDTAFLLLFYYHLIKDFIMFCYTDSSTRSLQGFRF